MRNLSTDALRAFVTTADLGGVTAAADQLGRSQPATSLQIKKLEEVLDTELFIRLHKKLKLSDHGLKAYEHAKDILKLNDQLVAQFSKTELAGQIRLGIPSEFATTLLPKIIGRFAAAYPNVTLEVFSDLSKNLTSEAQRSQYDMILALHENPVTNRRGLLRSDELVWVGGEDTKLDKQQTLPLVLAQDGCIYRKRALRALDKIKHPWRIIHTNPDLTGIKTAIQEGLGVTVLARSTVPDDLIVIGKGSKTEQLPTLGAIDISLQYDKRSASESVLRLADFIRSSL
jgi:DNA-binding transcriptional LysR family regulator